MSFCLQHHYVSTLGSIQSISDWEQEICCPGGKVPCCPTQCHGTQRYGVPTFLLSVANLKTNTNSELEGKLSQLLFPFQQYCQEIKKNKKFCFVCNTKTREFSTSPASGATAVARLFFLSKRNHRHRFFVTE